MSGSLKGMLIILSGVVQGVGLRWFVRQIAVTYGIKGYVKNLFDGSVEVYGEGDEASLKAFFDEIRIGPGHADISGVKVNWSEYTGKYNDFRILS